MELELKGWNIWTVTNEWREIVPYKDNPVKIPKREVLHGLTRSKGSRVRDEWLEKKVTKEEISRSLTQSRRRVVNMELELKGWNIWTVTNDWREIVPYRGVGTGGCESGPRPPKFSEDTKSALPPVAKCSLSSWKMLFRNQPVILTKTALQ
jgi:hypothetical protein